MDYLIPADVIAAAAEAMEIEAIRCLGRDLGTVHRDDIAAAALGAALAAGLLAVPAAHQDQWVKQIDDPKELPGLLLRMADLLDALESLPASLRRCADVARIQAVRPHVNETSTGGYLPRMPIPRETYRGATAAPADDEAAVKRMAVALRNFFQSDPATRMDAARAALAALREGQ